MSTTKKAPAAPAKKKAPAAPAKKKAPAAPAKKKAPAKDVPMIFPALMGVMRAVSAISKDHKNEQQRYQFRGIDDVYNELHDVLAANGVITIPTVLEERMEERQSKSGGLLIYRVLMIKYQFLAGDGSFVETKVVGEGMDSGDKAANKAMSVAHKYALLQTFCIPTGDDKDPEVDSPDPKGPAQKKAGGKKPNDYPRAKFSVKGEEKLLTKYEALKLFGIAKDHLGTEDYYAVLGAHGYEKSDQVPLGKMREIYEALVEKYQDRISKEVTEEPKKKKEEKPAKEESSDGE